MNEESRKRKNKKRQNEKNKNKPKAKTGRIPILTKEKSKEICDYIKGGNCLGNSAILSGIGKSTLFLWLKKGRDDVEKKRQSNYVEFLDEIKKAKAYFVAYHLINITDASKKEWQASAWLLERTHHKQFGRKDRVTNDINGKMNIDGKMEVGILKIQDILDEADGRKKTK